MVSCCQSQRWVVRRCSYTNRTARSRNSGENLFALFLLMAPFSQGLEPPQNPGRFNAECRTHSNQIESAVLQRQAHRCSQLQARANVLMPDLYALSPSATARK